MKLTTKTAALVFGVVFTVVGVLGFIPAVTPDSHLLGIFHVDTLHNIIHLASGLLGLALASMGGAYAKKYLVGFGAVYALVALVGIVQGNTVLGLIEVNLADNLLHVVLAVGLLGAGLTLPEEE
jgi:hypothetical protein